MAEKNGVCITNDKKISDMISGPSNRNNNSNYCPTANQPNSGILSSRRASNNQNNSFGDDLTLDGDPLSLGPAQAPSQAPGTAPGRNGVQTNQQRLGNLKHTA